MLLLAPVLAACATNHGSGVKRAAFTSREFGVKVSPRVTTAKYPPHGGGRYMPNNSYVVRNVTYQPVDGPGYVATGEASWYGQDFHGRRTANGEIFGAYYLTAASPVLPIPCYARVTNLENGRSVLVRVNDRGPYMQGRVADLSYEAALALGYLNQGSAQIQIAYAGPAPLNGDDSRMLMASLKTNQSPLAQPDEIRVASAEVPRAPVRSSAPTSRDPLSGGLVGDIVGLFGYAEGPADKQINGAIDAANAMATRAPALDDWKAAVDDDSRKIKLGLGTFTDQVAAISISEDFAMLGAVDEDQVSVNGRPATRLTLTHLKPGVERTDVMSLVQQLGLTDVVLY
jgi:rare lipoprotein A